MDSFCAGTKGEQTLEIIKLSKSETRKMARL
jgi:hypothetical protein